MALFLFEMEFFLIIAIFFEKFEMTFIDNREFERVSARISGAFWLKLCACATTARSVMCRYRPGDDFVANDPNPVVSRAVGLLFCNGLVGVER